MSSWMLPTARLAGEAVVVGVGGLEALEGVLHVQVEVVEGRQTVGWLGGTASLVLPPWL